MYHPTTKLKQSFAQHDFMHLSFFADGFREFVGTLAAAMREMEQAENPMAHIHPILVHEAEVDALDNR